MRAPIRSVLTTVTVLAAACAGAAVTAPSASATVTRLCLTYAGCERAGMSHAGYAEANRTMYWRMYSGHNCTNYVAYRLVRSGMPNIRPWEGSGNATNWGVAMSSITDGTPQVGSVAWWRAGVYPAGSSGHVAYVEKVVSADEIIVSQDSWGGEFSWARITRDSKGWPSGFIHFNDVTVKSTAVPRLRGVARVGGVLTATPGGWSPADVTTAFQWRVAGRPVPGATSSTYRVRPGDEGKRVRVLVTASKPGLSPVTVLSRRSAAVTSGSLSAASNPTIAGDPVVDRPLTADPGVWSPVPDSLTYQWLADGVPVEGADQQGFAPTADLVGRRMSVQVTARRAGYEPVTTTSIATAPVAEATLAVASGPVLSDTDGDGRPGLGETLTLAPGSATAEATPVIQWVSGGRPVAGARGTAYTLTPDDLGKRITARLRWTRPGYRPATAEVATERRVKTIPSLRVVARPGRGRMTLSVTARADGLGALPGRIRVIRGNAVLGEVALADGSARLELTGLPAGTRTYRVVYPGLGKVQRGVVRQQVTVR